MGAQLIRPGLVPLNAAMLGKTPVCINLLIIINYLHPISGGLYAVGPARLQSRGNNGTRIAEYVETEALSLFGWQPGVVTE